ncbi:BNR-4 repeat-containing protein [Hirschia litorea]|uniref:BNR-4 repeat-containing protein n=1 Tax=Hirschia litorea TaxID=1199156 RepID=A0ABW2INV7_9PROT
MRPSLGTVARVSFQIAISAVLLSGCRTHFEAHKTASDVPEMFQATTLLSDAGWCWYQDPRVVISNGKLIVGGISGIDGDVKVGVYDLETGLFEGQTTLHPEFEIDDHDAPVFHIRDDNSLVAMWAKHGRETEHYYAISEPDDYLNWGETQTFTHPFELPKGSEWGGVTYMNLYEINAQNKVYNFYRNGPDYNPNFITSDDDGSSWSRPTHFLSDEVDGTQRPYARYVQVDKDTIGVSFTDAHPRNYGNSLYYAEFDGTSFSSANGEWVNDLSSGPLRTSIAEKVFKGSESALKPDGFGSVPGAAWTIDVEVDGQSNPHIGYSLYNSNQDNRFRLASWTGSDWNDREIAYAGPHLYEVEASYTGLLAIDPDDPQNITISTNVDPNKGGSPTGTHEIYMARIESDDSTDTIEWIPVTTSSEERNIRPIIVTGEGYKVLLWMQGRYTHFQDFDTDIVGTVLAKP